MDVPDRVSEAAPFRRVEAGRGLAWLTEGWGLFLKNPAAWLVIALVLLVTYGLLSVVPFLGQIAGQILAPLFAAGLLLGCRSLENGGGLRLEQLFVAFRQDTGRLATLGLLNLAATFLALLLGLLAGGGLAMKSAGAVSGLFAAGMFGGLLTASLVFLTLLVPMMMAFWFAPALVFFRGMEPLTALKQSFSACLANTAALLLYGLFGSVLVLLAAIPAGLGFLVAIPVLAGSYYLSYKDIFE